MLRSSHPNLFSWVKYLVEEKNLDIYERDKGFRTLFFNAVKSKNREIVDVMKYIESKGLDLHKKCGIGRNVAFSAISFTNPVMKLEIVKYLRERDVDFTLTDARQETVLTYYDKDRKATTRKTMDEPIPKEEIEVILECLAAGAEPWWGKESGDPVGYLKNQEALTWRMLKEYK